MKIDNNTVAQIAYKIHSNSTTGDLIEFADESSPRSMIFGYEKVIPGFEANLLGKDTSDEFSFELSPEEAFGQYREELLVKVPKSAFMVNGELREDLLYIGNLISMMDNQGNPMKGKVTDVSAEEVSMDFNHPLAGNKLFIKGKVMSVRPITQDDLQPQGGGCCGGGGGGCGCGPEKEQNGHGHSHGEGGGCGCGPKNEEHAHAHSHAEGGDDCQVCGNPPEQQGQGIGDCRC